MAEETKPAPTADRRTMLRATALGVAAAGVGVTAAACSSSNSMPQGSNAQTAPAASAGPVTLTTTSAVPVGGGFIDQERKIVVTQPTAGQFKAFSAVCTHAGCTVGSVQNNVIHCPCHFSEFSAKDGSVVQGPAASPLSAENVSVQGSNIVLNS